VEPIFRVSGRREGFGQIPDGVFLEDNSVDSLSIQRFNASAKKLGVPTTKPRRATGTLASSANLLLPDAVATGKLIIVPNAIARQITVDPNTGLVNGVSFIDRHSKREFHAPARVLVLGASTLESTRIMLNSVSNQHPEGLANSSGVLGRYLFDQFYVKNCVQCIVPEARGGKGPRNLMGGAGYIPRFRNLKPGEKKFLRGYAFDYSSGGTPAARYFPLFGDALFRELADATNSGFNLTTMGTVLPRLESRVRINPDVKDAWGIPALHVSQKYTENEHEMARDATDLAEEVCRGAGFEILARHAEMVPPGESIHELGTCRMGKDPRTSVLNGFNQCHDVKNLFVVDGSAFTSGGSQNPTLTILALTMRASEYIADQMQKRKI
jgi:choline dehydrogenase-like flavoprotein